jgi:predicted aspartyl protease
MMKDMGIFRTTIAIENGSRRGVVRTIADVMVDTGSEYTWVPASILAELGLARERTVRFVTADGRRIDRPVAFAIVHAGGTSAPDIVVFAEPGDMTLLGAHSIEGLNLRLDLVTKELVPAGPVPVAPGLARSA